MNKPNLIAFISTMVAIPVIAYATQVKVNVPGGTTGPGSVPIGGMVAVMPHTHANAWQPPASGQIKDGFMRADGATVPACSDCVIPAGQVLPNMNAKYPRGGVTTSGSTGGANTVTLAPTNIPQLSTNYTPAGTNSASSVSSHSHSIDHDHEAFDTVSGGSHTHTGLYSIGMPSGSTYTGTHTGGGTAFDLTGGSHTHNINVPNLTGTSGGSGATAAAQAFTGTPATITVGTGSPTVVNNEPAYVEVVWVIRVK